MLSSPLSSSMEAVVVLTPQILNSINAFKCLPVIGGASNSLIGELAGEATSDLTGNYTAGGIIIEPTSYKVEYSADVSEQVLVNISKGVDTDEPGRQFFVDNIAPHPRVWDIVGYIPSSITSDLLSSVPAYPGMGYITSVPSAVAQLWSTIQSALKNKQDYLQTLFYKRKCFNFKTRDNEYISNAVMSKLVIERTPEVQNKLGISVTIQEVNILSVTNSLDAASRAEPAEEYNKSPLDASNTTSTSVDIAMNNYRTESSTESSTDIFSNKIFDTTMGMPTKGALSGTSPVITRIFNAAYKKTANMPL